jgi:hypothetical protein
MKRAIIVLSLGLFILLPVSLAQAPVPFINLPLVPDAIAPGSAEFSLTVNGTGFVSGSVVNWNGVALATQFINGSRLTATVPAADIAVAGTGWVTVVNPAPGGGTSSVAFFVVSPNVGRSVAFVSASSPAAGDLPTAVAVGDFNGDGKLDLVVLNEYSYTLSILLGDGTGNFTLASSPNTGGSLPRAVVVGDFNGDGKLDLAVANDANVSILLGDGTGNFTLASSTPFGGGGPFSVAAGDFNGDGKLDLAVGEGIGWAGAVSIMLGDGTGNFTVVSSVPVGAWPYSLAVGDFNGDGKLDVAAANACYFGYGTNCNTVNILLGDGAGGLTIASSPAKGSTPYSVAVGDFNRDGKLDLATANSGSNTVSILLGDGTGNFTLASSPASGARPYTVAVGDLNGDNNLDLVVANEQGGNVSILLGDGAGNFDPTAWIPAAEFADSVTLGDFNNDGKLDLAVADGYGSVSVLLQALPAPAVSLSPTSLDFGEQLLGTMSGMQYFTVTNTGSAPLTFAGVTASPNFGVQSFCRSTMVPGESCQINVLFKPRHLGSLAGSITINDNASNSPQTGSLSGIGTLVSLSPASLDFGDQLMGTSSQPQAVTLINYGTGPLKILGIGHTGSNPGAFAQTNTCGTNVPGGGSCTITVTFTPRDKGFKTATLEVSDDGGGSPQTVTLSGTGTQ